MGAYRAPMAIYHIYPLYGARGLGAPISGLQGQPGGRPGGAGGVPNWRIIKYRRRCTPPPAARGPGPQGGLAPCQRLPSIGGLQAPTE